MRDNPISATLDFEAEGLQHGHLKLPYSHDDSAWGSIMIPLTVVKNGSGPTAILTGGNHGDEYEGPIALFDLAQRLAPDEIQGRVIIVPAMNFPAFGAATRTSPIDKGNMNRVFPGRPDGTVTEKIADYFQRRLLPLADTVLDIHSGGKTLEFLPFAAAHVLPDKDQQARSVARHVRHGGRRLRKSLRIHRARRWRQHDRHHDRDRKTRCGEFPETCRHPCRRAGTRPLDQFGDAG
jgi:N-alpha-acetyl-L-2,4-diaminobutyrate deacetylase